MSPVVYPFLFELLRTMERLQRRLIVAGGLGIYLKRKHVIATVSPDDLQLALPEARATVDIDVFIPMQLFAEESRETQGIAELRVALELLGYTVCESAKHFQFIKEVQGPAGNTLTIKLDLHARLPRPNSVEAERVQYKKPRIRRRDASVPFHAYGTPEAFAVEEGTQDLLLDEYDYRGEHFRGKVTIPHPFASLCMKLKAALDHERREPAKQDEKDEKHAFDVYLLLAMLTKQEWDEIRESVCEWTGEPVFQEILAEALELFATPDSPACTTILRQGRRTGESTLDLPKFCVLLRALFEPPPEALEPVS